MFKIGDFSKLTKVSIHMLRYYDEAGLFEPAYIDPFTGYRQYAIEQIPLLNKLVFLRDAGFTIAEISAAVTEGDKCLLERFEIKQQEIATPVGPIGPKVLRNPERLTGAANSISNG